MIYVLLCAGKGTRLHPLTFNNPKCLFSLDENYSILQRMIDNIRKYDKNAEIITVVSVLMSLKLLLISIEIDTIATLEYSPIILQ